MDADPFEAAAFQWQHGERRVRDAAPRERATLERIVERTVAELRRRLGGPFSATELAELYTNVGTSWVIDIAASVAPDDPAMWDQRVGDAAFGRYLREAADFAGGRRILE